MLQKILSQKTCAACQLCCQFDKTDIWELPVLPPETITAIQKIQPKTEFVTVKNEMTFAAPTLKENDLFSCPMLTECGCCLSEKDKPFDCKIWPFRLMKTDTGKIVITVSELCNGIKNLSDDDLRIFLQETLSEYCFSYAKTHPSHVKPLMEGYRIIL